MVHTKYLSQVTTPRPQIPEDAPFKADPKEYRAKVKFAKEEDNTLALSADTIKLLQKNMGRLLFYGKAVDMKLLVVLITMAST